MGAAAPAPFSAADRQARGDVSAAVLISAAALGLALYMAPAAWLPLQRTNEAMYAYPPIEMLRTGDYLVPRYESQQFLEKPPLSWWIIAASYRLFGISPFAGRLPSMAASLATVLLLGHWVSRRSGMRAGVAASLVLLFLPQFAVYARTYAADSFLTLAIALAAAALDDACRREGSNPLRGALAGAALALAFYFKGLVGIVLPAGGVAAGLLLDRVRPTSVFRRGAWAFAVFLALVTPWHWAMTNRLGAGFWRTFYWSNQFLRGATKLFMVSPRGPFFYLGVLAWSAFPWSLLLAGSLARPPRPAGAQDRGGRPSSLPLGFFGFGFVFLSCLVMKREVYLMPLYPAVAVLVAESLSNGMGGESRWRRLPWLVAAVLTAAVLVFWARGARDFSALVGSGRAALLGVGIAGIAVALAAGARRPRAFSALAASALFGGVLFFGLALCEERLEARDPLPAWGERLRRECASGCDGFLLGLDALSLDFYTRFEWVWVADPSTEIPRRVRHRKAFLVMWSELDVMLKNMPFPWRVIEKGEVPSPQWTLEALGLRRRSPFQSLSLVELSPP
jgi:4-amino-4-deoxy-L-arabinose transferase-like glycosyltransferase